jgi:hypothetical protein
MARRIARQVEEVKRDAARVHEVEVPLEQPVLVVGAAPAAGAPGQVERPVGRRRLFPARADRPPTDQLAVLVRGKRLHRLMDDERFRVERGARPGRGKRAVHEHIVAPAVGNDEPRNRRVGTQQVRAIAAVQHLQDLNLRRREPLRELRRRLWQGLERVGHGLGRGRRRSEKDDGHYAEDPRPAHANPSRSFDREFAKLFRVF